MSAGVIIRVGDLCIHNRISAFMGVVLRTTVVKHNAKCDIFWADLMKVQTNTIDMVTLENYRIVR